MKRTDVRELLEELTPADDRERHFQTRMLELLGADGDPFSRGHYSPGHFTASVFVLDAAGTSLVFDIDHTKLKRWLQPGGHIDPDDPDVFAAAQRELEEETGLVDAEHLRPTSRLLDIDIHRIPARKKEPEHEHFDLRFLLRAKGDVLRAGSDAGGARWVRLEAVSLEFSDESVIRAVRKVMAWREQHIH